LNFEVRRLNVDDPIVQRDALALHKKVFPDPDGERQVQHNMSDAPEGTAFFGAFDGDRLIGVNGFIRHSIVYRHRKMATFQSCSTATDPNYRGRGIFSGIVKHAQNALASECPFLIGFPNEVSEPIFTGVLGFRKIPLVKLIVPAGYLTSSMLRPLMAFSKSVTSHNKHSIYFDQNELIEWKRKPSGRPVSVWSVFGTSIWGLDLIKRIKGCNIRMYSIGGVDLLESHRSSATTPHRPPLYYTLIATCDSEVAKAMRFRSIKQPAGIFMYYPMPHFDETQPRFEVFSGLADFF
jgi:hypothetical protein